jgi:hypothetical protein
MHNSFAINDEIQNRIVAVALGSFSYNIHGRCFTRQSQACASSTIFLHVDGFATAGITIGNYFRIAWQLHILGLDRGDCCGGRKTLKCKVTANKPKD